MGLLRTPFFDRHVAAGGRMVPFAGFEMPVQYEGVNPEHLRVRRSVGLFDVSHMGEVRVRGPRAEAALDGLLSNDVHAIAPFQAQYNAMCNEQGGVVDDLVVYRLAADDFLVCVNAANRAKDFAWMTAHNPYPADALMTDDGDLWAQLAIQGRHARATAQKLTDVDLGPIGTYRFRPGTFAGVADCLIARTGYTGEDGFEVFIPADRAGPVWDAILSAGAEFDIAPIGLGARDTLRLEMRYCLYGHELDDVTSPLQANLGWITKLGKPDFVGKDAIVRRKETDSTRLVGMVLDSSRIGREGMRVLDERGNEVGKVTSGTRSPLLEKSVCMAYVDKALVTPGTRLVVDVRGKEAPGVVVKGPFYTRDY